MEKTSYSYAEFSQVSVSYSVLKKIRIKYTVILKRWQTSDKIEEFRDNRGCGGVLMNDKSGIW
ncbi:hypothetical protein [Clostridium sp. KNHs205]|jgi:hypothetical protein|uniref:hypothetical protein n=1 Tax=Clostridium sp. KNHs205 TaxID=1449050 RepID=UPI00051C9708|nr:hypothetical protein [Clostridium sp. KNHs205]